MVNEYRFFYSYDGTGDILKSKYYNDLKLNFVVCTSILGFIIYLFFNCNLIYFILLETGIVWNIYFKLNQKISFALCIICSILYFFVCCIFTFYANGFVYLGFYIPLQLMAISKQTKEDYIQFEKRITYCNYNLMIIFMCLLFIFISLIDYGAGGKFLIIDSISATFLVVSAIVRNERYFDYYIIRIVSLLFTLALWIVAYYEFNSKNILLLIIMYFSYLFYDIYNYYFVIKYSYLKKEEIYQKV